MTNQVTDNRTFVELWPSLTPGMQDDLRENVLKAAKCTYNAFMNWTYGQRTPMAIFQNIIVRELRKLGISTKSSILFPRKK